MPSLAKNLKFLMSKLAVSQRQLESAVNKGQTTIGNWIRGETYPNSEDLVKLSAFFGISMDDLCLTDLEHGNLITEAYLANFRKFGKAIGQQIGHPTAQNDQFFAQYRKIEETEESALWAVLQALHRIGQDVSQIKDWINKQGQK